MPKVEGKILIPESSTSPTATPGRNLRPRPVVAPVSDSTPAASLRPTQLQESNCVLGKRINLYITPSLAGKESGGKPEIRGGVNQMDRNPCENNVKNEPDNGDQITTLTSQISAKRPRVSEPITPTGLETITPPLSSMLWVHHSMKYDLLQAYYRSPQEFGHCCNFWYRYALWKKKDITKNDKQQFCQAAFSTSQAQHQPPKHASPQDTPIGVRVHRQWTQYAKHLHLKLRRHFEALLLMFLESPDCRQIVQSILQQVHQKGSGSISQFTPCIEPLLIRDNFIKGNVKLVSDVWHPIMDVAPPGFLVANKFWGQRFIDATCTVLAWMVTHFFRLECPEEKMKFEIGKCPVPVDLITSAMQRIDAEIGIPTEFFIPNKPTDWKQRKNPAWFYGELWNIRIVKDVARDIVEDEIDCMIIDPPSGTNLAIAPTDVVMSNTISPTPSTKVVTPGIASPAAAVQFEETLSSEALIAQADWVIAMMQARKVALLKMEAQAREETELLEDQANRVLNEMMEYKVLIDGSMNVIQTRIAMEHFIMECKKMIPNMKHKDQLVGDNGQTASCEIPDPTTNEIIGAFAAWIGLMKRHELFKGLVTSYELAEGLNSRIVNMPVQVHAGDNSTSSEYPNLQLGYPQIQTCGNPILHTNQGSLMEGVQLVNLQNHHNVAIDGQQAVQNRLIMGNPPLIPGQQFLGQSQMNPQIYMCAQGQTSGTQNGSTAFMREVWTPTSIMISSPQQIMPTPQHMNGQINIQQDTSHMNAVAPQSMMQTFQRGVYGDTDRWVGQGHLSQQTPAILNNPVRGQQVTPSGVGIQGAPGFLNGTAPGVHGGAPFVPATIHHGNLVQRTNNPIQQHIQRLPQHHILTAFGASDWAIVPLNSGIGVCTTGPNSITEAGNTTHR